MNRTEFNNLREDYPEKKFCLHNGFAGFCYGYPSNPKWISFDEAYRILLKYEEYTKINPLNDIENTWYLFTLVFENEASSLKKETGYNMIGFNEETEALYGDDGVG